MTVKPRVICRIDLKGKQLIKGRSFEGVRVIGSVEHAVEKAENCGFDELFLLDSVASLYDREPEWALLKDILQSVSIPVCVGGGIRSIDDVCRLFDLGVERICINSHAFINQSLLPEASQLFGSQAVVSSVQCVKINGSYIASFHCGREPSSYSVLPWMKMCIERGAGEIFLTSIKADGQSSGFDTELVEALHVGGVSVPVVYSGGVVSNEEIQKLFYEGFDAIAIGFAFHSGNFLPEFSQRNQLIIDSE